MNLENKSYKNQPKVSIIVAVYNTAKYIREALDSVVNQTLVDIECICVDDCSTDDSFAILNEYAQKDSRIKVFQMEQNSGPGVVRNFAIEKAIGEYIMILDPDDFLELDACEVAYDQISKNENDVVIFSNYQYNDLTQTRKEYPKRVIPFLEKLDDPKINLKEFDKTYFYTGCTWAQVYKRSFLIENDIKYLNISMCEDTVFLVKAYVCSSSISVIKKPLYNYRCARPGSATVNVKNWQQIFTGKFAALECIEESPYKEVFRKMYLQNLINSTQYYAGLYAGIDLKVSIEYVKKMREYFIDLDSKYDLPNYVDNKTYKKMKKITKLTNTQIDLKCLVQRSKAFTKKTFSIKNEYTSDNKKIKILTLLGKRIKLSLNRG